MGVSPADNLRLQLIGGSYSAVTINLYNYIEEKIKNGKGGDNITISSKELLKITWIVEGDLANVDIRSKIAILDKYYIDFLKQFLSDNGLNSNYDGNCLNVYGWHLKHNLSDSFSKLHNKWRAKVKKTRDRVKVLSAYIEDDIMDIIRKSFRSSDKLEFPSHVLKTMLSKAEQNTNIKIKYDSTFDEIVNRVIADLKSYGFKVEVSNLGRITVSGWRL